jgi:hypothetical protein
VILNKGLRWGAWGSVNGRPVLAGEDESTSRLWGLPIETSVAATPKYSSDQVHDIDRLDRELEATALAELITSRSA